jgi:hypothetical protein
MRLTWHRSTTTFASSPAEQSFPHLPPILTNSKHATSHLCLLALNFLLPLELTKKSCLFSLQNLYLPLKHPKVQIRASAATLCFHRWLCLLYLRSSSCRRFCGSCYQSGRGARATIQIRRFCASGVVGIAISTHPGIILCTKASGFAMAFTLLQNDCTCLHTTLHHQSPNCEAAKRRPRRQMRMTSITMYPLYVQMQRLLYSGS